MNIKMTNNYTVKMEKLIALVHPHTCLYDTDHENYKSVKFKDDIWNEIGAELNSTGQWAKKEWRKLRDCHRDALKRRVGRIDLDGTGIKKWKYEDQMDFLLPYMKSKGSMPDHYEYYPEQIESENDITNLAPSEMCDAQIPSPSSCSSGTQKTLKRARTYDKTEPALDYFEQSLKVGEAKRRRLDTECHNSPFKDPLDTFFESMCATTKALPKKYQLRIKRILFDCVQQSEEEILNYESDDGEAKKEQESYHSENVKD